MQGNKPGMVIVKPTDLKPAPNDTPHPNKWEPPEDGCTAKPWLKYEPLRFIDLLDKRSDENPGKIALTWLDGNGKVNQKYTYKEVSSINPCFL